MRAVGRVRQNGQVDESAPIWLPAFLGVAGVLLLTLGVLSSVGRFPRNFVAGIRTSLTMANDQAWVAGHKAAAPLLVVSGVVTICGAGVFSLLRTSDFAPTVVILTLLSVLVLLWKGLRVANQAARPFSREASIGRVSNRRRR